MSGTYDSNPGIIWYVPRSGTGVCPLLASDIERVVPGDTLFCGEIARLDVHYIIARDRRIIEHRWVNDEFDGESLTHREISPADFISANCPPDGKLPPDLVWIKGAPAGTAVPSTDPSTTPGTPLQTKGKTKGTTLDVNDLNDTDWTILKTLYQCGARDRHPSNRTTLPQLSLEWSIGNHDSRHVKASIKKLKGKLIDTAKGPSGGIWLTAAGVQLCSDRSKGA